MGRPEPMPFGRATLDAFFAAVLVNDVVDRDLVIPSAVPLFHRPDRLADYHRLCRQTWSDGLDDRLLIAVAWKAMKGRPLDPEALTAFKHVRAKFKQLRYASILCDPRHRAPALLEQATVAMGQLQDACRHRQHRLARLRGAQLRLVVARPLLARLARQAAATRIVSPEAFGALLDRDLDRLGALMRTGVATGPAFHAARKVVSRHNSFWTAMSVLHPGAEHHRLFRWMSAVNGAMGAFHDRLVERRAKNAGSYGASFTLPQDVAEPLARLVALPRTAG